MVFISKYVQQSHMCTSVSLSGWIKIMIFIKKIKKLYLFDLNRIFLIVLKSIDRNRYKKIPFTVLP